ncbi:DUF484 family protein [Sphingomonas sp. LY29]|uniref:DUF484 family protein n=1 Tax=Sphingomonas sp. LY29 TaxID=3095341 RepID=UPI002D76AAE2|nr:DUF484 family protein [Sphingomonas sp. LY29]WRP25772.1 DUF484 family protein [Sphingomonas sp. LY29]
MGQLISFEERAVASLRDRLGAAESANEDLIAFARGHSGATAAIHAAVLSLMDADDLDELFDVVTSQWPRMLGLDSVGMAIVADGQGFRVHGGGIEHIEARIVDRAIASLEPITMRTVTRGHALFGAAADGIRSEALLQMAAEAPLPYGLLMLGQRDAASLDARHGAQLLGFLADSLGAMLRRWLIDR